MICPGNYQLSPAGVDVHAISLIAIVTLDHSLQQPQRADSIRAPPRDLKIRSAQPWEPRGNPEPPKSGSKTLEILEVAVAV